MNPSVIFQIHERLNCVPEWPKSLLKNHLFSPLALPLASFIKETDFVIILRSFSFLSYSPPHHYIVPLMMNDHGAGSQNEFLLRPHKYNTFNTSPERFITVIKVLFSNILPQRSLPAMIPDIQQKQSRL